MKTKKTLQISGLLLFGIFLGGMLFSKTERRSVFAIHQCLECWRPNQVLGLMASVGIQLTPGLIPYILFETDKAFAIKHPTPFAKYHAVIFPKKDIPHLGDLSPENEVFVHDSFRLIRELIQRNKLRQYQVSSNGPAVQDVNYLHFHLMGSP